MRTNRKWCLCGHNKDTHDDAGCCGEGCFCGKFIGVMTDEEQQDD